MSDMPLTLIKGNEYKIRVENLLSKSDFENSFFSHIYNSAIKNVEDIVKNTSKYYSEENKEYKKDIEEYNNIIAFIGERGSGKSSAMVSFAEALRKLNNTSENEHFKKISDNQFVCLDVIDPSLFECNESVFEVIIAKMFAKFSKYYKKEDHKVELEEKKRLLNKFQKVYKNLKTIDSDRKELYKNDVYNEGIIETLTMLASGSNMRESFIELVQEFLGLFTKTSGDKQKNYLVIAIDDLDMNISHATSMVEQIRKYLLTPNVIVLMAVKLEQLSDSIEQEYRKSFEIMLEKDTLSDYPKEMAVRYLEKLIPNGRKLFLPQIRVSINGMEDKIPLKFGSSEEGPFLYERKGENETIYPTIQEAVLGITYNKTGLIFIKPEFGIHQLVPDNIRELYNYMTMMDNMKDPVSNDIKLENLEKFESYFINTWVRNNLSLTYIDFIDELLRTDNRLKNKFVVTKINDFINEIKDRIVTKALPTIDALKAPQTTMISRVASKEAVPLDKIIINNAFEDKENFVKYINQKLENPMNISTGDVLVAINTLKKFSDKEKTDKFSFALKTVYSIILLRLVLEETDNMDYLKASKFIGGDLFGNYINKFLPTDKENNYLGRTNFDVDYPGIKIKENKDIKDEVNLIINTFEKLNGNSPDLSTRISIILVEWLHYFLYLGDRFKNYKDGTLIYKTYAIYNKGNIGVKRANFDISAFLFFSLTPKENLKRIFYENINKKTADDFIEKISAYSILKYENDWLQNYKMIIPVYSFEIVERIMLNIKDTFLRAQKDIPDSSDYASVLFAYFDQIREIIEKICDDNMYLDNDKVNGSETARLIEAFEKCTLVSLSQNNNKSYQSLIESILASEEIRNTDDKDVKGRIVKEKNKSIDFQKILVNIKNKRINETPKPQKRKRTQSKNKKEEAITEVKTDNNLEVSSGNANNDNLENQTDNKKDAQGDEE